MDSDLDRRLDAAVASSARRQRPEPKTGSRRVWGKVVAVDVGPPPTVTVRFEPGADPIGPLSYLDTGHLPLTDDYVMVINVDGDMVVLGRMAQTVTGVWAPLYLTRVAFSTNYRMQLSDTLGVVLTHTSATPHTVTIPNDVDFIDGSTVEIYAKGSGQVTVAEEAPVVLRAPNGKKSAHQYATIGLRYDGVDDEWIESGDTTL